MVIWGKTIEVKCHFRAMLSWIPTINIIYHHWCWPWSTGWGMLISLLHCKFTFLSPFSNSTLWKEITLLLLKVNNLIKGRLEPGVSHIEFLPKKATSEYRHSLFWDSASLSVAGRTIFFTSQIFRFWIWSTHTKAEWLTSSSKVSRKGISPKSIANPSDFSSQPQVLLF